MIRWCAALVAAVLLGGCADEPYDLVILNGTIVDGSGGEPFQADVGIRGARIATIGALDEPRRVRRRQGSLR